MTSSTNHTVLNYMQAQPDSGNHAGLQITHTGELALSYMKDFKAKLDVNYNLRGNAIYSIELSHDGLKKHRIIKGYDRDIVARKAELQVNDWLKQFETKSNKTDADYRTAEAETYLEQLNNILKHTLTINDAINWEKLKDEKKFPEPYPVKLTPIQDTSKPLIPKAPDPDSYAPKFSFMDNIIPGRKKQIMAQHQAYFEAAYKKWQENKIIIENAHKEAVLERHNQQLAIIEIQHQKEVESWEAKKIQYYEQQKQNNSSIDRRKEAWLGGDPEAIIDYCDMVLSASRYPESFPHEWELDYLPDTKLIIIDYCLPAPEDINTLKSVKYNASKDSMEEKHITQSQRDKLYDSVLYQIVLRTIHEMFESDTINAINIIVFNGIVSSIDISTGKQVSACVLSLQVNRQEFMDINLSKVDPKACFKALKGVGSSKLHGLAPVPPIMAIDRADSRFVAAYDVINKLEATTNLAAIDWEDFEHLIREVFEKEFSGEGAVVKVTQASRDGGVDAVAFDPDPIRGGKIVIQAKRYTNTVGVAAVRDLYGTVMNEGAIKGILVTTSDYGPDAYSFANGKPLALLNGANLLHLLQKHGHKATIDVAAAKKTAPTVC